MLNDGDKLLLTLEGQIFVMKSTTCCNLYFACIGVCVIYLAKLTNINHIHLDYQDTQPLFIIVPDFTLNTQKS